MLSRLLELAWASAAYQTPSRPRTGSNCFNNWYMQVCFVTAALLSCVNQGDNRCQGWHLEVAVQQWEGGCYMQLAGATIQAPITVLSANIAATAISAPCRQAAAG